MEPLPPTNVRTARFRVIGPDPLYPLSRNDLVVAKHDAGDPVPASTPDTCHCSVCIACDSIKTIEFPVLCRACLSGDHVIYFAS